MDWSWELNADGPLNLLLGPMLAVTRRMFQSDLDTLKALMESGKITAARTEHHS